MGGRVCMAAFVGWLVAVSGVHFPGLCSFSEGVSFEDLSKLPPLEQWSALPAMGKQQIIAAIGIIEHQSEWKIKPRDDWHRLSARGQHHPRLHPATDYLPGFCHVRPAVLVEAAFVQIFRREGKHVVLLRWATRQGLPAATQWSQRVVTEGVEGVCVIPVLSWRPRLVVCGVCVCSNQNVTSVE